MIYDNAVTIKISRFKRRVSGKDSIPLKGVTGNVVVKLQIVKTSDRSQMNPKNFHNNIAIPVQLLYIAGHSL